MFHRDDRRRLSSPSALLVLVVVPTLLSACTRSQHPVLYPNAKLKQVGQGQADQDIDDCRKLAGQYVESTAAKDVGKGAAVGATAGVVRGVVKQTGPSPVYKQFVNRCLHERGYEVLGWQ